MRGAIIVCECISIPEVYVYRYALDGLQEEEYSITAKKDHFEFDVVNARLSAAKAEIADIIAKKYPFPFFFFLCF